MNCFYHPDTAAVGICKHCYKGICAECRVDTDYGLACQGACEVEVQAMDDIINMNKRVVWNAKTSYRRNTLFASFAGILFVVMGLAMAIYTLIGYFVVMFGLVFIGYAIFIYSYGKRVTQQDRS